MINLRINEDRVNGLCISPYLREQIDKVGIKYIEAAKALELSLNDIFSGFLI